LSVTAQTTDGPSGGDGLPKFAVGNVTGWSAPDCTHPQHGHPFSCNHKCGHDAGTSAYAVDQTTIPSACALLLCRSGCLHGFLTNFVEDKLVGYGVEELRGIERLCTEVLPPEYHGTCVHGLAHGFYDIHGFETTAAVCELFPPTLAFQCYTGLYMKSHPSDCAGVRYPLACYMYRSTQSRRCLEMIDDLPSLKAKLGCVFGNSRWATYHSPPYGHVGPNSTEFWTAAADGVGRRLILGGVSEEVASRSCREYLTRGAPNASIERCVARSTGVEHDITIPYDLYL
jgi:hypothetical protein